MIPVYPTNAGLEQIKGCSMAFTQVNGIRLYYEIDGAGEPVVFLHGLGSSTRDWEPQTGALRDGWRCIALDMRGHGQTEKPRGPYSVKGFAADTLALLDQLEIEAAHLVGVSMGGMVAFQMAVDAPARVRSMVIINAGPEVPMRTLRERWAVMQRLVLFRLLSMQKIGEVIGGRLFPDDGQAQMRAEFTQRWAENDRRAYLTATRALAGWSVAEHLEAIHTPALVIAADQDYTPVAVKEAFVRRMPHAELAVIDNARHAVNYAQPHKVNPLIAAFLARQAIG
jgi:pimeloyl-ACP methyl ester carboxylesterase